MRRRRVHEIATLFIQASHLKDVDDVVDIALGKSIRRHSTDEVGVAVEIVLGSREDGVDVRVAAGAQQVVHAAAVLVLAVPGQAVGDDGGKRAHVGEAGPKAVVG